MQGPANMPGPRERRLLWSTECKPADDKSKCKTNKYRELIHQKSTCMQSGNTNRG